MLDFIHRGFYIGAICFFIAVGAVLILIGDPEYLKPLVSEGVYNSIYTSNSAVGSASAKGGSTTTVVIGSIIAMFSTIIGFAGGFICRFSKKHLTPKKIDVLRAQDLAVFLIDGLVYKKDEAIFYNLEDLGRIKVTLIRNLYFMELERDITIAPEGNANEKEILHRDNETDSCQGTDASIEEGGNIDKPFK